MGATAATSVAALVTTIGTAIDIPNQHSTYHAKPTFYSFMLAFGTIIFSFGGSGTFPTIQQDMHKSHKFPLTVLISYICKYTKSNNWKYFDVYHTGSTGKVFEHFT